MMTIPQARDALSALAEKERPSLAAKIQEIVQKGMYRRKATRKAPPTRPSVGTMSKKKIDAIKKTLRENPRMALQDVAQIHNVNPGRVSEINAGFRR